MKRPPVFATFVLAAVLALLGAFAAGLPHRDAGAQDATPDAMADHPLVGTWIVDPEPDNPANTPSLVVYTADGIVLDPVAGFAGSWQATGPRTAVFTLSGIFEETGSYLVIRGPVEVEEATDTIDGPYTVTIVGADGTVLATDQGTGHATRLLAESGEAGRPLAGFPTWPAATPEAATSAR